MDVIAHTGAVRSGVVHAEDCEILAAADGDLGDVGHEVVGNARGVLAYATGGVGAARIEVTQDEDVPLWVGLVQVAQELLDEELGAAIRVGGADLDVLGDGHFLDQAVDGG